MLDFGWNISRPDADAKLYDRISALALRMAQFPGEIVYNTIIWKQASEQVQKNSVPVVKWQLI